MHIYSTTQSTRGLNVRVDRPESAVFPISDTQLRRVVLIKISNVSSRVPEKTPTEMNRSHILVLQKCFGKC